MALSRQEVQGKITLPTDVPASIQSITFTLLNSDQENDEWVAKYSVSAEIGTNGEFTVELWPNDAGEKGSTKYGVEVRLGGSASVDPIPNLFVRKQDYPWDINDLIIEQSTIVPGYTNRVMTRAQYLALSAYEPNTLYLVRL